LKLIVLGLLQRILGPMIPYIKPLMKRRLTQ